MLDSIAQINFVYINQVIWYLIQDDQPEFSMSHTEFWLVESSELSFKIHQTNRGSSVGTVDMGNAVQIARIDFEPFWTILNEPEWFGMSSKFEKK